jgi:two-component system, LytTR family, response regulator
MMKLKTLIVDDEEPARSRLKKLIAAHPEIEVIGEATDGVQAVAEIVRLKPELLFLDVQMPGLTGFETLAALPRETPPPLVIFATAFDQYALQAFDANAVSYLLKPINRERLAQAVDRASKLSEPRSQFAQERLRVHAAVQAAAPPLQQIIARRRDRYLPLSVDQAIFFIVEDGVVRIHTENDSFWSDYQLSELESRLPAPPFFRAHRSVIVNLKRVKEIIPTARASFLLIMSNNDLSKVQVSERQSKRLRQMLSL